VTTGEAVVRKVLTRGLSGLLVLLGVVAIGRTAFAGGGELALGYVLGALMILAGGLRLYLSR
jgi:hypothetical protein